MEEMDRTRLPRRLKRQKGIEEEEKEEEGILSHAINLYNSLPLSVTNGSINGFKLRASDYYFSKFIEN